MAARGVEVGVGYISVIPEADKFAATLRRQIGGENLGRNIGDDINKGIKGRLGDDVDLPTKHLRDKASSEGAAIGSKMKEGIDGGLAGLKNVAVGLGAVGAGAVVVGKMFFDAFSDLTESTTKAQTVFGDSFDRVDVFAQGAAKSMGISRQGALEAAGTFGNLFRAMEIGTEQSADMSTGIISLASDLASFNNASPEDVLVALKSGLVGETEPLRAFGVNLNAARIEAEALRLGLVKGNVNMVDVQSATINVEKAQAAQAKALKEGGKESIGYREATLKVADAQAKVEKLMKGAKVDLDAGQKAQAAYSLIMKDTTLAQGDFSRTSEGAANQTRILTARWEDFKAKVGEKLSPIGTAALGILAGGLDALSAWWDEHGPTVVEGVGKISTKFHEIFGEDPVANFKVGADIVIGKFHEIFGEDPVANYSAGADIVSKKLDGVFGEDKVANFNAGAEIVKGKFQEIFGEDPVANFQAGAVAVSKGVDDMFGEDKLANFYLGADQVAAKWDEVTANFETGTKLVNEDIGPAWSTLGDILIWFKDKALDPLWGYLKDNFSLDTFRNNVTVFASEVTTVLDVFKGVMEDVGDIVRDVREHFIDPAVGLIQTLVDHIQVLRDNPVTSGIARSIGIVGFDEGGVVPGVVGSPQLIMAHGGETVLPTHRSEMAAMRGAALGAAVALPGTASQDVNFGDVHLHGIKDAHDGAWWLRREMRTRTYLAS